MKFYLALKNNKDAFYLLPCDSKEEAMAAYKVIMREPKYQSIISGYKIIKRDMEKYKDGWII